MMIRYLADAIIQCNLWLISLSGGRFLLEQHGVKDLTQEPSSGTDLIVATPGLDPLTFQAPAMYHSHLATGYRLPLAGHLSTSIKKSNLLHDPAPFPLLLLLQCCASGPPTS